MLDTLVNLLSEYWVSYLAIAVLLYAICHVVEETLGKYPKVASTDDKRINRDLHEEAVKNIRQDKKHKFHELHHKRASVSQLINWFFFISCFDNVLESFIRGENRFPRKSLNCVNQKVIIVR